MLRAILARIIIDVRVGVVAKVSTRPVGLLSGRAYDLNQLPMKATTLAGNNIPHPYKFPGILFFLIQ